MALHTDIDPRPPQKVTSDMPCGEFIPGVELVSNSHLLVFIASEGGSYGEWVILKWRKFKWLGASAWLRRLRPSVQSIGEHTDPDAETGPELEVSEHTSSLRRQSGMSPAEELRGINNPAALPELTRASRRLINTAVVLSCLISTVGAQIEMNENSLVFAFPLKSISLQLKGVGCLQKAVRAPVQPCGTLYCK
ncbi:unnamed protein product [Pleuronectes platessa]|uniref:Uncharacterized protein n=1 Tax=Pleuronectes platessa TaxID=8262 RepID=A0A9N7V608_PLEPL|nr:unnamed protein product [Pleuronectes platessa]